MGSSTYPNDTFLDVCNSHHLTVCKPCAEAGSWTRSDLHPSRDELHLATKITLTIVGVCSQTNGKAACAFSYDPWPSPGKSWQGGPVRVSFRVEEHGPDELRHRQSLARAEIRAVVAALQARDWVVEGWKVLTICTDAGSMRGSPVERAREWRMKGWRKRNGMEYANKDLWGLLLGIVRYLEEQGVCVRIEHVKSVKRYLRRSTAEMSLAEPDVEHFFAVKSWMGTDANIWAGGSGSGGWIGELANENVVPIPRNTLETISKEPSEGPSAVGETRDFGYGATNTQAGNIIESGTYRENGSADLASMSGDHREAENTGAHTKDVPSQNHIDSRWPWIMAQLTSYMSSLWPVNFEFSTNPLEAAGLLNEEQVASEFSKDNTKSASVGADEKPGSVRKGNGCGADSNGAPSRSIREERRGTRSDECAMLGLSREAQEIDSGTRANMQRVRVGADLAGGVEVAFAVCTDASEFTDEFRVPGGWYN